MKDDGRSYYAISLIAKENPGASNIPDSAQANHFPLSKCDYSAKENLALSWRADVYKPTDETMTMTLRLLAEKPSVPTTTAWYLADLGEARGKQELFTKQSPQRLRLLHEHALIESALSSNRIEGVEVDKSRVGTLIFGKPAFQDRDEEEVGGYGDALKLIHDRGATLPVSESTIKKLHRLSRGKIWDAGKYKDKDIDIIQTYPDGRSRVRFKSVPAKETPKAIAELTELWQRGLREKWVHPFAFAAALILDFLCIHPFRDGNGRVSRLLFLLACYHCGLEVGRYISLERLIEPEQGALL